MSQPPDILLTQGLSLLEAEALRRFGGWFLIATGVVVLLGCTFVGVLLAHLIPVAFAASLLYWGYRCIGR